MNAPYRASPLLDTTENAAASLWDELLTLQVDLFLAHELLCLEALGGWHRARDVLEAGCGNGHYLSRLHALYPEKTYLGIDLSPALIAAAARRTASGLSFRQADFLADSPLPASDLLILRFVVQHLRSFEAIFDRAARILRPRGALVIVESDLGRSALHPPAPLFAGLLATHEDHQARHGRLRTRLQDLPATVDRLPDWCIAADHYVTVPRLGPHCGTPTVAMFSRWIDLCERAGGFDYPFERTRAEIAAWAQSPASFSRITLRVIELAFAPPSWRRSILPASTARPESRV